MYDSRRHHRRSIRLKGHDYTQRGMYFVTICAHQHDCLFGVVNGDAVRLNDFGRVVLQEWFRTAELRLYVRLGAYVVMPNHFHGIIVIVEDGVCDGRGEASPRPYNPTSPRPYAADPIADLLADPVVDQRPRGTPPKSLGAIVGGFKSAVTRRINEMRKTPGGQVWQRNYYEHIVRDDADLDRIQTYIYANPGRWDKDRFYVERPPYAEVSNARNQT